MKIYHITITAVRDKSTVSMRVTDAYGEAFQSKLYATAAVSKDSKLELQLQQIRNRLSELPVGDIPVLIQTNDIRIVQSFAKLQKWNQNHWLYYDRKSKKMTPVKFAAYWHQIFDAIEAKHLHVSVQAA